MDCGIGGVDERVEQESETGYRRIERVLVTRTLHQATYVIYAHAWL